MAFSRNQKQPRTIVVSKKRVRKEARYDQYQQLAILLAACALEKAAIYVKESADGSSAKVKVYTVDEPVDFWLDLQDEMPEQVETAINEIWGSDTYKEAVLLTGLGRATHAPEPAEAVPPTRSTKKAAERP